MINLLSKLKHECYLNGVELLNSEINGDSIKMACSVNGRRDTELNAYIVPDGDSFNFYTISPAGNKSEVVNLTEEKIIPTLVAAVNPTREGVVTQTTEEIEDQSGTDIVTIEVEDGVFDTKEVPHGTYNNSRFAYSMKYSKMGTITEITHKYNSSYNQEDFDDFIDRHNKAVREMTEKEAKKNYSKYGMDELTKTKQGVTATDVEGFKLTAELNNKGILVLRINSFRNSHKSLYEAMKRKYPNMQYGLKIELIPIGNKKLSACGYFDDYSVSPSKRIMVPIGEFDYVNKSQLEKDLIRKLCEMFNCTSELLNSRRNSRKVNSKIDPSKYYIAIYDKDGVKWWLEKEFNEQYEAYGFFKDSFGIDPFYTSYYKENVGVISGDKLAKRVSSLTQSYDLSNLSDFASKVNKAKVGNILYI